MKKHELLVYHKSLIEALAAAQEDWDNRGGLELQTCVPAAGRFVSEDVIDIC